MRIPHKIESLPWAEVTRIEAGTSPLRHYAMGYPSNADPSCAALEVAAIDQLSAIAAAKLDAGNLRTWIEVQPPSDDRPAWALEQDFDGFGVREAWQRASRVRPHDVVLAWRPVGVMANDVYQVSSQHNEVATHTLRHGPWAPTQPIGYPNHRDHLTVRVRHAPIAAQIAARVIVAAGRAVAHLHTNGIVHGHLTTDAIALTRTGDVIVHRIGTYACYLRGAQYRGSGWAGQFYANLTPECVNSTANDPHATPAADVFQLGNALYELIAFSKPWMRATSLDSIQALRTEIPPAISTIAPAAAGLDAILACAMARDPALRPSLHDFIRAVDDEFRHQPTDAEELARIVADAAQVSTEATSRRGMPM
ncbi:MAG: protein kinase [Kofleriaceae bacterium]|nr:protein kinase [Kofleriaceae bacterium]